MPHTSLAGQSGVFQASHSARGSMMSVHLLHESVDIRGQWQSCNQDRPQHHVIAKLYVCLQCQWQGGCNAQTIAAPIVHNTDHLGEDSYITILVFPLWCTVAAVFPDQA